MSLAVAGVYKITNSLNGKSYIGFSNNIGLRWRKHFERARRIALGIPCKNASYIHQALAKYGVENFKWEILDFVSDTILLPEIEKQRIAEYHSVKGDSAGGGYNLTFGGEGITPSEETRKKMVISRNKRTDKPAKGYHHTDEAKKRMSLSHKGLIPANKGRTGLSHWGYEQKELARIRGLYRTLTEKGRGIKVVLNEKSYYFVSVRECSKYFLNIESHNAYIEKRLNKGIIRSNTYGIGIRVLKDSVIEYCTVDEILRNRNDLLNYIGGLMCIS